MDLQRLAWRRYRVGQVTVAFVAVLFAGLAVELSVLPVFDDWGVVTGHHALWFAAITCAITAARADVGWLRALSGAAAVGAAGWRGLAAWLSLGLGPALVWLMVVLLLLTTWTYLLPPPVQPPTGG